MKFTPFAASSKTATACLLANGMSFTAVMPIVTVATAEFTVPSFTLKVNVSGPFKLAVGV